MIQDKECEGECPCNDSCDNIPEIYNPVCGVDGKTYTNRFELDCEKIVKTKITYDYQILYKQ